MLSEQEEHSVLKNIKMLCRSIYTFLENMKCTSHVKRVSCHHSIAHHVLRLQMEEKTSRYGS